MNRAIVIFLAVAAMAAGAAGCEIGNGNGGGECNNGADALGEGGGGTSDATTTATTGATSSAGAGGGPACAGCVADGVCVPGDDLGACGRSGGACEVCSFGERCDGSCKLASSICVQQFEAEGIGDECAEDSACSASEWCAVSCCDPVTHACFAVGACIKKRAPGEQCDHVDGDRQCLSGTCDPVTDTCV